jgi:23S rRNA pseudouridine2605 synthase
MKKKSSHFDKFIKKKSNAAIKEEFRQEKKKWKKEREEYFIEKKRSQRSEIRNANESQLPANRDRFPNPKLQTSNEQMPLNKFIAHCGVCSRRDAAEMVKLGKVKVNGQVITEPGHKVSGKDDIRVAGKKILLAKNLVYILLNKPKDFITTTDDPQGRKTVLDLVKRATNERVYPVGRLDRNTSGVLLLTNDGELSQKLTHPSNEIRKIYAVTLDKPLEKKDFDQILRGVVLDDGPASVDKLAYTDTKDKTQLGVELHSGRNRIVRRIFEGLGYDVKQLDRVMFAGLTKKNVERGKWRYLNEKEVRELKYFGKGK